MPPWLGVYFLGTPELLTRLATRVKNQQLKAGYEGTD